MSPVVHTVEPFAYSEIPWADSMSGISERLAEIFPSVIASRNGAEQVPNPVGLSAGLDAAHEALRDRESELIEQIALESSRAEERGYRRGLEAGILIGREEAARGIEAEREKLRSQSAALIESMDESRSSYFQKVEHETVRLALAVAARILRREAQMDPLLLTGAVRVALGQLSDTTIVRLLVPSHDEGMWRETIKHIPRLRPRPQVVGDANLELGECRIETELGTVDLGLAAQLKEIERGFLDHPGFMDNTHNEVGKKGDEEVRTGLSANEEESSILDTDRGISYAVETIR